MGVSMSGVEDTLLVRIPCHPQCYHIEEAGEAVGHSLLAGMESGKLVAVICLSALVSTLIVMMVLVICCGSSKKSTLKSILNKKYPDEVQKRKDNSVIL